MPMRVDKYSTGATRYQLCKQMNLSGRLRRSNYTASLKMHAFLLRFDVISGASDLAVARRYLHLAAKSSPHSLTRVPDICSKKRSGSFAATFPPMETEFDSFLER